ncbi:MAG: alpha-glucosidase, partial [Candidatus Lokiarchaeota archaeon]|nr:alpha-glucosidase [Candidatus Lokiarchaeota archaeon]
GYDIMNYRKINPEYGDMDLCDTLIDEIHRRKMKIVLDLVLNHTSIEHEWFKESRSSKDNPKRDWYIWKKGRKPTKERPGGKKPPNNWQAMITGSGWHYDPTTHEYYWAQFLPFQPDLNYRNPEVRKEMLDTVKFWCQKKADGFRLDIINALYEDKEFRDNPFCWKLIPSDDDEARLFRDPIHTLNHPDTIEFMKQLRSTIDGFKDKERFFVGEVSGSIDTLKKYLGEDADGLNLVFLFQSLTTPFKAKKIKKIIQLFEDNFPDPYLPTWVFGNHDRSRRMSRLGNNILKAKLSAALQLTVRGVPFIYYGEEIGMEDGFTPANNSRDALVHYFGWIPQFIHNLVYKFTKETLNRDYCRTPMQWNSQEHAGFTTYPRAWLPIPRTYRKINVETQLEDEDSILNCYRRFLKVRKVTPALNSGSLRLPHIPELSKKVLAYERIIKKGDKEQIVLVLLNFSNQGLRMPNPSPNLEFLVSTSVNNKPIAGSRIILNPWECVVLEEK